MKNFKIFITQYMAFLERKVEEMKCLNEKEKKI